MVTIASARKNCFTRARIHLGMSESDKRETGLWTPLVYEYQTQANSPGIRDIAARMSREWSIQERFSKHKICNLPPSNYFSFLSYPLRIFYDVYVLSSINITR